MKSWYLSDILENVTERLKEWAYLYRNPIRLYIIDSIIWSFGPDIECMRCTPVPPMTPFENVILTIHGVICYFIAPTWINLIRLREKYKRDGHLD